jgi:hypothetical protein
MVLQHNKSVQAQGHTNRPGFFSRLWSKLLSKNEWGEKYTDFKMAANSSKFFEKQQAILKNGARAKATVLRVEPTRQEINGKPVVLLSLKIDEYTSVVIQVTSEAVITRERIPTAGERIVIAFDPDDTGIIVVL